MRFDSIVDVKQAIDYLYSSRDNSIQQTANQWLQEFQKKPEAWGVASMLLEETNNIYAFFGAHTLCNKIRYDFNELSDEQIHQLFGILFKTANDYKDNPSTVRNEICLDIASLLLRWPELTNIVNVAVKEIGSSGNGYILLNILSMLPVEVNNKRMPIFDEQRRIKINDMITSASDVLSYLNSLLSSNSENEQTLEIIYSCLKAWIALDCFSAEELASTQLLPFLFQAIHNPSLFEVCSDCLKEVLHYYYRRPEHSPVIDIVLPQIAQMKPLALEAVRLNDVDMCRRIVLIFIQLGDDYIIPVIDDSNTLKDDLLDTLMTLYSFPSMEIAVLCVDFWSELFAVLVNPEPNTPLYFLIQNLVKLTLPHFMFPEDYVRMNKEDISDFKKDRRDVGDVIKQCSSLLGNYSLFSYLHEVFVNAVNEFMQLPDDQKQTKWMYVESLIYALRMISEPYDDIDKATEILSYLFRLPPIYEIENSSLILISMYCKLIKKRYDLLEQTINFFFSKLQNQRLHSSCVALFNHLCCDCGDSIISNAAFTEQLLKLYVDIPSQMSIDDQCTMMEGLCNVIRVLPQDMASHYIELYLNHQLQQAQTVLQNPQQPNTSLSIQLILRQLTVIIRYTTRRKNRDAVPFLVNYFSKNWSLFETINSMFCHDEYVIENMCRFFKYFMRLNRDQFLSLLQPTVQLILEGYSNSRVSSYVYCGSVIIGEYGLYTDCQNVIHQILSVFCETTLSFLSSDLSVYTQNPNLVEDFYDLCGRALEAIPDVIFNAYEIVLHITEAAIVGIQLQHREANNSIIRYLAALLTYGHDYEREEGEYAMNIHSYRPVILNMLQVCGQELMNQLIGGLVGGLPENRLTDPSISVITVLNNYYDYFRDLFIPSLERTIQGLSTILLSPMEKQHFLSNFVQVENYKPGWFEKAMLSLSRITRRREQHE